MKKDREEFNEIVEEDFSGMEAGASSHWVRRGVGALFLVLALGLLVVYAAGDFVPALARTKLYLSLLLGKCGLLLPVFAGIVGSSILSDEEYSFFSWKNFFLFLLFLSIPALAGYFDPRSQEELITAYLKRGAGGGAVGCLVNFLLGKFLSREVSLWVETGVLLVSLLFVLPYKDLFHALLWPIRQIKKLLFGSREQEAAADEDEEDEDEEDEEEIVPADEDDGAKVEEQEVEPEELTPPMDDEDALSARKLIAKRRRDWNATEEEIKPEAPSAIEQIYAKDEFKGFSDEIRKENILKRIMSRRSDSNVYNKPGVRKAIKEDPMSIPSWQGTQNDHEDDYSYEDEEEELTSEEVETFETVEDAETEAAVEPTYPEKAKVIEMYPEPAPEEEQEPAPKIYRSRYKYPKTDLLDKPKHQQSAVYEKNIQRQCAILQQTLVDFNVKAKLVGVTRGPSVTRFELEPAPGVKVSSITSLADDIALKLAASGVRIEAPIPGKAAIGIEVPNGQNDAVFFKEIVDAQEVKKATSPLCIGLGKDISGNVITIDLTKMPHLLVAGSTGSGKSVCINTLISGILFKAHPEEVKLILVDPKVVELSNYNGIPHLLTPVVTDMKKAASALQWARKEMERRYQLFAEGHAREINTYNLGAKEKLPYIVVIIDELSDLMMVARIDVEDAILALAQKARAAGIHLVLATQRPSVDVITGVIKANIPSRISFAVSSQIDSRTILDVSGAEKLIGKGDMLYYPVGMNKPLRVQGAFISDGEINRITQFVVDQHFSQEFVEEVTTQSLSGGNEKKSAGADERGDDEIFPEVVRLVLDMGQVSASMLQRRFRVGYTRAARLVDTLEKLGVVGPATGSKPREVIMSREEIETRFFNE